MFTKQHDRYFLFFLFQGELIFRNTNVLAVNNTGRVKLLLVGKRLFSSLYSCTTIFSALTRVSLALKCASYVHLGTAGEGLGSLQLGSFLPVHVYWRLPKCHVNGRTETWLLFVMSWANSWASSLLLHICLPFFLFFSPGFCLHVCCFSGEHSCSVSALNTRLSKYPGCVHADQFMLLMVGGDQSAYSLVLIHVIDIKKKPF